MQKLLGHQIECVTALHKGTKLRRLRNSILVDARRALGSEGTNIKIAFNGSIYSTNIHIRLCLYLAPSRTSSTLCMRIYIARVSVCCERQHFTKFFKPGHFGELVSMGLRVERQRWKSNYQQLPDLRSQND